VYLRFVASRFPLEIRIKTRVGPFFTVAGTADHNWDIDNNFKQFSVYQRSFFLTGRR
jgi:hypothetical protein